MSQPIGPTIRPSRRRLRINRRLRPAIRPPATSSPQRPGRRRQRQRRRPPARRRHRGQRPLFSPPIRAGWFVVERNNFGRYSLHHPVYHPPLSHPCIIIFWRLRVRGVLLIRFFVYVYVLFVYASGMCYAGWLFFIIITKFHLFIKFTIFSRYEIVFIDQLRCEVIDLRFRNPNAA